MMKEILTRMLNKITLFFKNLNTLQVNDGKRRRKFMEHNNRFSKKFKYNNEL